MRGATDMIRAAVVGLGKMGMSHAAIVGAHPDIEMIGVCDTSSFMLGAFKKFSKTNTYTDYQKMIDEQKLDIVFVATPTKYHYPVVRYALERDLHVFCEKPFCLKHEEGTALVELAHKKKLVTQVGYHNQFLGTFREMKRLLQKNVLGELVHFTGEAYGPVVVKEKGGTWRSKREEGGGCLYDYASHALNLIQEVISYPKDVRGALLKSIYSRGVEDAVYALLTLENGVSGVLSVNWSDETYRKMSTSLTVIGTKGKIICDATEIKIYLKEENKKERLEKGWTIKYIPELAIPVNFYLRGEEYSAQVEAFIDCVKQRKPAAVNTFEQALYTDSVIEMIMNYSK
jgi:predicted dehydrogenase